MRSGARTKVLSRSLAVLVALSLAGCVPRGGSGSGANDTVTVITGTRGLTVNPYSPRTSDRRIGRLLFRGLFVVGTSGEPEPDLAIDVPTVANGGITDGGRTVTYRIRDDVMWHDGDPLTARDVAFTIREIVSGRVVDDPGEDFTIVTGAEAVDDVTVRVTFSRPDSVMAWRLAPYVLPEHLLGGSADPKGSAYWDDPVGSGPYSVASVDPDGSLLLEPVIDDAPSLRVRSFAIEADATRAFDEAAVAVWLDAVGIPAGSAESLSATWGPVWNRLIFNVKGPHKDWADREMRLAIIGMTTTTIPANLPDAAYPYGIRPPERSVPDTRGARVLFEERGYRYVEFNRALMRGGRRLDLNIGMSSVRPEDEKITLGMMRVYDSTMMHSVINAASFPLRPTWSENGDLARGKTDGFLYPYPDGRPWGWAFPYRSGDEPSFFNQYGLNFARVDDARLQDSYEAVRTAPDPPAARARMAEVGRRVYELGIEVDLNPVSEMVLSKGVTGVQAWPVQEEALAQAAGWRILSGPSSSSALTSAPVVR